MLHVATLLPFKPTDPQQLEKKRHIGNDLVIIIFHQSNEPFDLASIASHQNHVIAFVQPEKDTFKVTFVYKNGVPAFTPELPSPTILLSDNVSRDFFLHKCNYEIMKWSMPSELFIKHLVLRPNYQGLDPFFYTISLQSSRISVGLELL